MPETLPPQKYQAAALQAQRLDLLPVVGSALYDVLEGVAEKKLNAGDLYDLYHNYVVPYLKEAIFVRFASTHGFEVSAFGVVVNQSGNSRQVSSSERFLLIDTARSLRDIYCEALKRELKRGSLTYLDGVIVRPKVCGEKVEDNCSNSIFELI